MKFRLTNVPKQCVVVDGSRMFAGNPGLPYTSSYGSGQFEASLFEQAVQYAATTAATQNALRSTLPSIYSPSPSGNNNTRTTHGVATASHFDESYLLDDDEDSSILSNLPNSCHDFELKELHIRLERNHSSPLIGGHSSPAVSSLLSSNCPSAEPPADLAEPEDLEVQLINECFEEQQRQNQMYQSGDLKTLFYHGTSEIESSKVKISIKLLEIANVILVASMSTFDGLTFGLKVYLGLTAEGVPFDSEEFFEPARNRRENFIGDSGHFVSFDQCFRGWLM
ncbi:unnamed protein product [Strongylus vulgaris]|uniref:Uncharacterized protein n=1 Tax=Strongylus vulgaris TaxID=40348 RepID=A0A3P7KWZ6_STRVU|nr:unnamed protein product [Strongylus vulgaris]